MSTDIVGGLFGINPIGIQNQTFQDQSNRAVQFAQLDPFQRSAYGMAMAGQQAGQAIGGLMGAEDPRLKTARNMEMAKKYIQENGIDINTPEGMGQVAQYLGSIGEVQGAASIGQQAQKMKETNLGMQQTQMSIEAKQRGIKNMEGLQNALKAMPPDTDRATFINTILPFMDNPSDAIKLATSKYGWGTEGEDANVAGQAGPLPKGGYRDIYGTTYQGGDFAKLRNEYTTYVDTLNSLNNISEEDAKNAVSFIDYTTKPSEVKAVGGKTTSAQTKIAVDQIFSQLRALPPGPASDADMAAAKSTFPGYGDEESLKKWIDEQKMRILSRVDETKNRFGNSGIFGQKIPEFKPMSNYYKSQQRAKNKANSGVPDKATFISAARQRPENAQYTDKQLSDYYDQNYGE